MLRNIVPPVYRLKDKEMKTVHRILNECLANDSCIAHGSKPVFIFAATWRSGSTLLQRMVLSGRDILVWGEPYARSNLIDNMLLQFAPFSNEYPKADFLSLSSSSDYEDGWTANLFPPVADLVSAHQAWFVRLFEEPAMKHGWKRWGIKEVRLSGAHAAYLKILFPNCKIVFLYRSPYEAWKSYRQWRRWFWRWPDYKVRSCYVFCHIWRSQVESFLSWAEKLDAMIVSYDDIVRAGAEKRLSEMLETSVKAAKGLQTERGTEQIDKSELSGLDKAMIYTTTNKLYEKIRNVSSIW